jgi:P-type Cu+ transporter
METESIMEAQPRPAAVDPAVTGLSISGMTCGNCVRHVTQAIQAVPGVQTAVVSLDSHQATVRWAPGVAPEVQRLLEAIREEGYGAIVADEHGPAQGKHRIGRWQLNLLLGIPVMLALMAGEWVLKLDNVPWFRWFSFVSATAVQVFAGAMFYRGAWAQLKARSSNMDTLVALGSTTAYAYSAVALFTGFSGHLYFLEAVAIISLISLGHWIESMVSVRASQALRKLLNLAPAVTRRRQADGTEAEVPVAELRISDLVSLRPGDRVPTDGEIVEGQSAVDESMLTGESAPVDKTERAGVYAGTVNLTGKLLVRVSATGDATALAHIIAAVQRAQNSRAGIQRLGDRVSSVFVPVVVGVALAAALWWGFFPESAHAVHAWAAQFLWATHVTAAGALPGAIVIAAAVLIIACPCAMGLATPAAIMAGSNAAAERGILVRDGVALEKAGQVTAVLFDKTGTVTIGKPAVAKTLEMDSARLNGATATRLAANLARHSAHPVSLALAGLDPANLNLSDWEEVRGAGVQARFPAGALVRLGSLPWLRESGVNLSGSEEFVEQWAGEGATLVGVAGDSRLLGLFAVKDTLKPGAPAVIGHLHRQGLKIYLVTGDNPLTARSIARQAGIPQENVFAEIRPERKADLVRKLQQSGERVAFVGDGINDAPALEQADLGIAVSRASDIAREAADMILLRSELEAVPESLGLARATLRTIKQNLFWAFFYNAIGIPLAALGFMSPILCAAAMGISDIVVIGNALRLKRWKLRS